MALPSFFRDAPREVTHWVYACHADPGFFGDERTMSEAHRMDLQTHNGLPCDGSGIPGPWCVDCRFGKDAED